MNIQRKNSAHHFRMQSEREQTLVYRDKGQISVTHNMCVKLTWQFAVK